MDIAANDVAAKNEKSLRQLAQAIALSRGHFKLIVVSCNYHSLCDRWSQRLEAETQHQHEFALLTATLPVETQNLAQVIERAMDGQTAEGIQLRGMTQLADLRGFLVKANQMRDQLRHKFAFPIVLWLDDTGLREMLDIANDLESWTTSKRFLPSAEDIQANLELNVQQVLSPLEQGIDRRLGKHQQPEIEPACQQLAQLGEPLGLNLAPDLALTQGRQAPVDPGKWDHAAADFRQRQSRVKPQIGWMSAVGGLIMALSLGTLAWSNREVNLPHLTTELERNSRLALRQFTPKDELTALLTATARPLQTRPVSAQTDPTVQLIESLSGILQDISLQNTLDYRIAVMSAEFNGDGTMVVSASLDGTVNLWDVGTGELLYSLEAHLGVASSAEFNRDGTRLVSASGDGTVNLWDVGTGERLHSLEAHEDWVTSAEFNGDGTKVVSASGDGTVKLWDVETGELLHSLEAHDGLVMSAKFNRDGTIVVSNDGTVKLWDVETGELLHSLEAHLGMFMSAEFNGDGTKVVSASNTGTVKLWDVGTGELLHSLEAHWSVASAEFNGDGTIVVSASGDGTVELWDVGTGERLHSLEAHENWVTSAEFNGDGTKVVSASGDGMVKLWDVETGELLHSLEAHEGLVRSAKFNRDGTIVVSASEDGTVKLWDVETGELLHSLETHSREVRTAELNGDSTRRVSV